MLWKLLAADIEGIEGISAIGTVFEKIFVLTKKVQMKRSVTGDDADGCCPQRKSHYPTLVGRKTKVLSGKADSDGVRFNKQYSPWILLHFTNIIIKLFPPD